MTVPPAPATMATILAEVATRYEIPISEFKQKYGTRRVYHAKQEAMYLMRLVEGADGTPRYSLTQIGNIFGLHYTTVLHNLRRYKERMGLG